MNDGPSVPPGYTRRPRRRWFSERPPAPLERPSGLGTGCRRERIGRAATRRCERISPRAARRLALEGEGIGLIPRFIVADDVASGRLERLLAGFPGPQLDIQALYLPQPFVAPRIGAYLDHLRRNLSPALEPEPRPDS